MEEKEEILVRNGPGWTSFVKIQKEIIQARIDRYNDKDLIAEQILTLGDLTPYQQRKTQVVTPFLIEALNAIKDGKYGICKKCSQDIPVARLRLVPGALTCVSCVDVLVTKNKQG
ncbi:MAG: TraR/DksA C4-type zinc finger protein [Candidatus Pacebacteria bacterium]|nr:TraR/DksA C4-type zinc finger protein [Candidatus Paceibacterota bacterium]